MPQESSTGVDRRFSLIILEELWARTQAAPVSRCIPTSLRLHFELWHPGPANLATENGHREVIGAIAMTEPGTGLTYRASRRGP